MAMMPEDEFQSKMHDAEAAHDERMARINEGIEQRKKADDAVEKIRKDNPIGGGASDTGGLKDAEEKAAGKTPSGDGKSLSPAQLKSTEKNTPWGGLWKDYDNKESAFKKIKGISRRRKVFASLGIGGVVGLFLAVMTAAPIFRVPSLMDGILGFVGEQVEEVVENRAQRIIISYLIERVGGNPDRYVITGSLTDSLWKTYRVNKLEDRIKYETGFEIVRGADGQMRLLYYEPEQRDAAKKTVTGDPKDLGEVRTYDDVLAKLDGNPRATKDFRKITRVLTKPTERLFSSKMKKAFERRYLMRMSVPEKDPNLTDEQNQAVLREEQVQQVTKQTYAKWPEAIKCITDNDCAGVADNEPIDTNGPSASDATKDTANKFSQATQETVPEATKIASETGENYADVFKRTLIGKLAAIAGVVTLIVEAADLAFMSIVSINRYYENEALVKFPSVLASQASGAFYAQWLAFGDNIEAGKMDLLFIRTLYEQTKGAENGSLFQSVFKGESNKGIPPDLRIDSDAKYPSQYMMSFYQNYNPQWIVSSAVADFWASFIHPIISKLGEWADAIIKFITFNAMGRLLEAAFGPDWEQNLLTWAIDTLTAIFGGNVDPLAKGAQWSNQAIIGGQAAMNKYCETNLGCTALTPIIDKGIFDTPLLYNNGSLPITQDDRMDMAVLPLKDRLFSLNEPHSLLNETFRTMPATDNPADWLSGIFGRATSVPGQLVATFSARTSAETPTLEQRAAWAGVQIMGGRANDYKKDIAVEVRQNQQVNLTCPPNEPQVKFNECQADKEIMEGMMCQYTDCPEYLSYGRPDSNKGFLANMQQLWESHQARQALTW